MERRNETLIKLAQTGLMAALCFVTFTFLQIKIPLPGGGATSFHRKDMSRLQICF